MKMKVATLPLLCFCCWCGTSLAAQFDYRDALSKALMFFECQRSGKLPPTQRVNWRGDSALKDGALQNVDLVGGYYDAGDNVKFGLPMAFTITLLSWNTVQYKSELRSVGQLSYALNTIKWGTDYFLKASGTPNQLWVQVGDPNADHQCWERPEDMDTPRSLYKIDTNNPGTEIAAETAAALAVASLAFSDSDKQYSATLLTRAKSLFDFADKYRGTYNGACPFYCSSGFQDELIWAAAWLYKASSSADYLQYIRQNGNSAKYAQVNEFSWDLKYAGLQILLVSMGDQFKDFTSAAEHFVCSVLPESPSRSMKETPGRMIHVRSGANTQYVCNVVLLISIYSDVLGAKGQKAQCGGKQFAASELMSFAQGQVDYLLGKNPLGMSYMVGFGSKFPQQPHHRGASIPSVKDQPVKTPCKLGFTMWYQKDAPNPNVLVGAIVGGPDNNDNFMDKRSESFMQEPCTYINAAVVGPLAKLSASSS